MLVPWLSVLAALPSSVYALKSAGQVPVRNTVIGGVGSNKTVKAEATLHEFATTPGKLRVTENSGVCETTPNVYQASTTGDWMRTKLPALDAVVNAGIRVTIYNGDADFIVNYQGIEDMLPAMTNNDAAAFNAQPLKTYTVNGHSAGLYKASGLLSYVRVSGAGHEVPAYSAPGIAIGQAAFQLFNQTMQGGVVAST
ncbi:Alpha/Beta hydrolase protein [Roridomyces roridus]|uniref:Alpha/Beta hydrolase protein n=1 Tax=Roridomyces roridus TaxID=1738132 RepID=A0AAD7C063_9AGAR|nr:Alpha/Beta hydrolase protein [Roridomyces roridus]